jgi:hypothetical protein
VEVVEYACGAPELLKGESLENIARGIDCDVIKQPVGICVGICPYNFPALVPMWMYPLALACGNTFILKPSEKVPLTGTRLIELLQQAGLPKGVLNIVHGGKECVDALLTHPKIRAISFVGSSPVAKYIFETGTQHGKRVQAAGGAKNYVFVMPDADFDNSVTGLVDAAFGCAGQRCMAGSTAVTIGRAADKLLPPLADAVKAIKVGATDRDPTAKMGAVISPQHRDKVAGLVESSVKRRREGCGRRPRREGAGTSQRVLPRADDRGSRAAGHDDREGRGVRAGAECDAVRGSGVRHRDVEQDDFRQRRVHLHAVGQGGARVPAPHQVRHGRHQRRRARAAGVLPVQRLGLLLLRRPAPAGPGGHHVLHAPESHHVAVVPLRRRRHLA